MSDAKDSLSILRERRNVLPDILGSEGIARWPCSSWMRLDQVWIEVVVGGRGLEDHAAFVRSQLQRHAIVNLLTFQPLAFVASTDLRPGRMNAAAVDAIVEVPAWRMRRLVELFVLDQQRDAASFAIAARVVRRQLVGRIALGQFDGPRDIVPLDRLRDPDPRHLDSALALPDMVLDVPEWRHHDAPATAMVEHGEKARQR